MDKYTEVLSLIPNDYLHIATSFALDNNSPKIEPSHLLRALLHKGMGLIDYIENTLDSDYYYILDWADIRVGQSPKSPYPMKEAILSDASKSVVKEATRLARSFGFDSLDIKLLLYALVSPGVGFSAEQLKTFPLSTETILNSFSANISEMTDSGAVNKRSILSKSDSAYYENAIDNLSPNEIIGFEKEIKSMIETLSRKDRANLIIIGETGVGKTSLINGFLKRLKDGYLPNSLKSLYPVELDLISIAQGVSYKGELEDRFDKIVKELSNHNQPLLIIENFHRVMDKQSTLS